MRRPLQPGWAWAEPPGPCKPLPSSFRTPQLGSPGEGEGKETEWASAGSMNRKGQAGVFGRNSAWFFRTRLLRQSRVRTKSAIESGPLNPTEPANGGAGAQGSQVRVSARWGSIAPNQQGCRQLPRGPCGTWPSPLVWKPEGRPAHHGELTAPLSVCLWIVVWWGRQRPPDPASR